MPSRIGVTGRYFCVPSSARSPTLSKTGVVCVWKPVIVLGRPACTASVPQHSPEHMAWVKADEASSQTQSPSLWNPGQTLLARTRTSRTGSYSSGHRSKKTDVMSIMCQERILCLLQKIPSHNASIAQMVLCRAAAAALWQQRGWT